MTRVTVGPKGQVVIPKEIRDKTGLRKGADVMVDVRGDEIIIKRVSPQAKSYVDYFTSTSAKKLNRDVDIKALLEDERNDRTGLH
jgi:AbrB family looped-hinge helix DNA binding protein